MTATTIGFAFDAGSGNKELTSVFGALYFIGCVAAVLAVRQNSVFTAVVQPPLLLFVAVPSAYYLFNSASINGIKDILINCGYPLIERFLLMLTTSVVVLLIGAARWYFGSRTAVDADGDSAVADAKPAFAGLRTKISALINGTDPEDLDETDEPAQRPRAHGVERSAAGRKSGSRRSAGSRDPKRAQTTRSRHARPPIDDLDAEPPRRRRPARDLSEGTEPPRRRPRPPREQREPREPGSRSSSREYRPRERDPRDRAPRDRDLYERPRRRPNRYDSYDPAESYDAPPPRPRRPAAGGGSSSTHHPVSRVRYRGSDDGDDRVENRTRPRSTARHSVDSDRWRYDS